MAGGGWSGVSREAMGLLADPTAASDAGLLSEMRHATAGQAFLEWLRLSRAAELHARRVAPTAESDTRRYDGFVQCATSIAAVHNMSQTAGERLLDTAVTMATRLPKVGACLRDGLISGRDLRTIITRTDLITDPDTHALIDTDIATALHRRGSWSTARLRDMVDRIVYRYDSYAVRERRKQALSERGFWCDPRPDGMAEVSATMTAEAAIAMARRIDALARAVCSRDDRSLAARRSDALFCLTMGVAWECSCNQPDCTAPVVPDAEAVTRRDIPATATSLVVHVVCDLETAAGDGETPAFIDGYGVISAPHLTDLLTRPGTSIRPVGGSDTPLPPHLPSDPYRPSTALDTILRTRDLYCTWPGCNLRAWTADLDHVTEYDHHDPAAGGQTCYRDMNTKCRFHHGIKTFTTFLDDQTVTHGITTQTITTPEGITLAGPAFTGDDLFPGLSDITFTHPAHAPPTTPAPPTAATPDEPTRRQPRLADKHARRRTERHHNRTTNGADDPPPF
ncbi:DUF222 domain-containing protein [Williamsia sp. CHRR-6]|uniref:DUF222 domain-containing protein n=1 Tax=Williamsia sp. CHRR-6 TaxID=2835871 RepID=UPI001BD9918C|nr:DUF222 domain-containing protein [Williamsia sp. CHRR-6]MBT0567481.1 DUF222 domain-containing protein [Williamsia sp. CHRR-6]